ncbi:MAG: hypothetical protein QM638_02465 [Nocardioides sp.]|uniref:hypothetical protein n=1 Tax=Nocardioides sp. TaxID=35761 RepID=UPI0039E47623
MRRGLSASIASGALLLTMVPASALAAGASTGTETAASADDAESGTLLAAVVTSSDVTVTSSAYDQYFDADNAVDGVASILAAGDYYINDIAIPGSESDFETTFPDGYTVDGTDWLYDDDGTWHGGNGGETTESDYADAAFDTATAIPAGLEIRILDTDGDGYADKISADYKEGLIADTITHDADDDTYSIVRSELSSAYSDEKVYDGSHFSSTSGEVIPAANFDTSISEGDVALFWEGPDGWHAERAVQKKGTFVDGADHEYYQIDDTRYVDAMRFSRDNIIISNRNGEYTNAHKYFGLMDDASHPVSLWLVPTSADGVYGAPVGLTSGSNAFYFLYKAIGVAQKKLAAAAVSKTGLDVRSGAKWTTPAAHAALAAAIKRARGVLESGANADLMDYQTYLLYLNLHGSADDIGASFAGFSFTGFDNQIETAPAHQAQELTVSTAAKTVRTAKTRKGVTSKVSVKGAKTSLTYRKISGSTRLSIGARTGKITVAKGTKAGSYRIRIRVAAKAGTVHGITYVAASTTAVIRVKVTR